MGYVYKTTNIINSKYYIGSHNGKKKNYLGSGLLLGHAIKKYGRENFIKEILYEGDDYRDKEDYYLKLFDCANDDMSYNMKNEVWGGSFPGEKNGMYGKKLTPEQAYKCGNAFRGKKRPEHSKIMSGNNNPMYGKSDHTHGLLRLAEQNRGKTLEQIHGINKAKLIRNTLSKSQTGKKHKLIKVKCPHCGVEGSGPNMTRYHFDKCKNRK